MKPQRVVLILILFICLAIPPRSSANNYDDAIARLRDRPSIEYDEFVKLLESVLDDKTIQAQDKVLMMLELVQASRLEKTDDKINGLFDRARQMERAAFVPKEIPKEVMSKLHAISTRADLTNKAKLDQMEEALYRANLTGEIENEREVLIDLLITGQHKIRESFIKLNPNISASIKEKIRSGKVAIGMTPDQAKASWGKPYKITETSFASGTREQWIYESGFLFFENGRLSSWQAEK